MQRSLGLMHATIGWPIFCFWTAVAGIGIALSALLGFVDPYRRLGGLSLSVNWGRLMWWTQPFWQRSIMGLDNLQGEGPWIIAANHQSAIDIPALFGLPMPIKVLAKDSNFRIPIMGPFLSLSGQLHTTTFFEDAAEALDAGISVVVFVEGTRSRDGSLKRFKRGAFELAARTGRPVVPVAIEGPALIMPKQRFAPLQLGVPVVVSVGEPLSGEDPEGLRDRCRAQMAIMLEAIRERVVFTHS